MNVNSPPKHPSAPPDYDVIIIGGALAGAACAVQLLARQPRLRVLIVEKDAELGRRVGESTVEVSSYFLGRVLGLTEYLNQNHLVKQGLRFWFMNDQSHCFDSCSEIGPKYTVTLAAYQVDRATLDEEVLSRAQALGAEVKRPATVIAVDICAGGQQSVRILQGESEIDLLSRWVIDASGVARFLARKHHWVRPNARHPIASVWTRWKNVRCWDDPALHAEHPNFGNRCFGIRHTATNHLIGRGWWSWWIPLKGGDVSVGIVYDQRLVDLPQGEDPVQRMRKLLDTHPLASRLLENAIHDPKDVHFRKNLAYDSEVMVGDGFALVGDAAAFIDPFYSPGMDWVAFSTASVCALVLTEQDGKSAPDDASKLNAALRLSSQRWFEAIYADKYYYMGDFDLMQLAFRLDLGLYYLGVVSQPFHRGWEGLTTPPFTGPGTAIPFRLIRWYNRRLARIGRARMDSGRWGRNNNGNYQPFLSYRFNSELPLRVAAAFGAWLLLELKEGWRTWFSGPDPMASRNAAQIPEQKPPALLIPD